MKPTNPPNCMKCGRRSVYHRVENPKQWRCRTCGHEFSDNDLEKKKEDDRLDFEARLAAGAKQAEARIAA